MDDEPATLDSFEALLAAAVAAPPVHPDLAPGTRVADRYEIERVLGAGGMGTVYLARDRTLDRAVALKLHRAPAGASRLLREAVAMARIAHPNVITVFEVGVFDAQQTFVAMEYVPGETLRAWAARRTWREVLAAMMAVGAGLVAVHAVGLVHRDVKPENVLVDRDGRIRLGDFGLALPPDAAPAVDVAGAAAPPSATRTSGTPAYMAPEQQRGTVDARSDQFAFCVTAWELVHPRGVPARIRRVLARGMAEDPDARYPTMTALLKALRAAERRARVVVGALVATVALGGAIAYAAWPTPDALAACADAGAEIDARLPAARFADARPTGDAATGRLVIAAGERLRARYRELAGSACRARARGEWSEGLATAARECRDYGIATASASIGGVVVGPGAPVDLAQVALALPDLRACGDPRLLAGWRPIADDPAQVPAVIAARARLDAMLQLTDLGRIEAPRRARDEVARSPVAAIPEVATRLDLLRAAIMFAEHDYDGSERLLASAYYASRARDDAELALRAVRRLIDVATQLRHDPAASLRWSRDGLAEATRVEARAPVAAAGVDIAAANAAIDADDPTTALAELDHAEHLLADSAAPLVALEIVNARASALAQRGDLDGALAMNARYLDGVRAQVGAEHPLLARGLSTRAALLIEAGGRDDEAARAAGDALHVLDGDPSPSLWRTMAELNLGAALLNLGDPRAEAVLRRARQGWVSIYGEDHPDVALVDVNLALIASDRGDRDAARAALEHGLRVQERVLGPTHVELAASLFNLAIVERDSKRDAQALAYARRCHALYDAAHASPQRLAMSAALLGELQNRLGDNAGALATLEPVQALANVPPSVHGWTEVETAKALIALHREPARVRTLLADARATYVRIPLPNRVAEVDALAREVR